MLKLEMCQLGTGKMVVPPYVKLCHNLMFKKCSDN